MGWRKKSFHKKITNRSPYAKELEEGQYRQRIKESEKNYKRHKLNVREVYDYDGEESSD